MTDRSELEVAPKYPPDWRDWVNEFPSIKSVALFCVIAWGVTAVIIAVAGLWGYYTEHEPAVGIIKVLEIWLDALNWLTAAAVFGVVGKRFSEKPEVIKAEGDAQVAAITAQNTAASPATVSVTSRDPYVGASAAPLPQPVTDLPDTPGEGD